MARKLAVAVLLGVFPGHGALQIMLYSVVAGAMLAAALASSRRRSRRPPTAPSCCRSAPPSPENVWPVEALSRACSVDA